MKPRSRFKIVFEKLADLGLMGVCVPEEYGGAGSDFGGLRAKAEEIAQLRRVVSEITKPEPKSFTTT
jgi:alkylation response protein AidB-like acyl-CoA dehydrogenase